MATTGSNVRGFVPARHFGSQSNPRTKRYTVPANNGQMFIGDPLSLIGGVATAYTTANGGYFLGVAARFYDTNGKPFTHTQPTRGPFMPANTGGFVDVYDDPQQLYEIESQVSAGVAFPGSLAIVVVTAGVTATGISGFKIGSVVTSATDANFRIVGLAGTELDQLGGAGNNIVVAVTRHVYRKVD